MKPIIKKVFNTLNNKLACLDKAKYDKDFIRDPNKDFTRHRKLEFTDVMKILIFSDNSTLKENIFKYYEYDKDLPGDVSLIKARRKIKISAFDYLLDQMNEAYPCELRFKGYRLIGVDGTDLNIFYDPDDEYTYYSHGEDKRGSSMFHINSAYDLLCHRYLDTIIQGVKDKDEPKAMYLMAERTNGDKQIWIGDRMYPTLNNMEHLNKAGKKFLFRVKDIYSEVSFFKKFNLPEGEFDEDVSIILTCRQTNEIKSNPHLYRWVNPEQHFDFLSKKEPYYPVHYRVVRFKIPKSDTYETLVTNLEREKFTVKDLQTIYKIRWDQEVSFRHLKYSINLNCLHCKTREFIKQEILAKMILYNLGMIIIEYLINHTQRLRDKYYCGINITTALHLIRDNLSRRKGGIPPDLEGLIMKQLVPLREHRKFERHNKPHSFICFNYRFS